MFTGIITDIGTIVESLGANATGDDRRIVVRTGYDMAGVAIGASIACSGACMTVVDKGGDWFAADVSGESIGRTASGMWDTGRQLNLERALKVGDELGGHIVTGHVDGVGVVAGIDAAGASHRVSLRITRNLAPYLAAKGSVTADGVSLTVNDVRDYEGQTEFDMNIIPHTWAVTAMGNLQLGQEVNIEIDVLARYLKRMRDIEL